MTEIANINSDQPTDFNGQIHIYLSYDYLPSRNFYLLSKNVNELYEYLYKIINDKEISQSDLLIFEDINTGNSVDILLKILEKINPSKEAYIALGITSLLIIGHSKYYETKIHNSEIRQNNAITERIFEETKLIKTEQENNIAEFELTKAQIEKTKAETEKIKLESERIKLETELKKENINKNIRDKILQNENIKRINRKLNSIEKQIMNKPINISIINGNPIYNIKNIE